MKYRFTQTRKEQKKNKTLLGMFDIGNILSDPILAGISDIVRIPILEMGDFLFEPIPCKKRSIAHPETFSYKTLREATFKN